MSSSSQSLYRKWRSQTFGDLVGQEPVIRTLKNALTSGKLAHAYLFTGPRGTGKTSTARLLAKTINCSAPVNGEPCNVCQQCREITAGNSFNVIEIDAASNRGIDSIRDLRDKVKMPPSTGKYKVYVLDEAHMLTPEAFNALLKTLEEPPPYAIFVLATTDVHKMLPTVLSRCQRFDFKRITTRQIVEHLEYVAGQENVHIERSAAELIARAAAGGMRDALSLLDQAIAYSGNEIALAQVQTMLGVADPRAIQKLIIHVSELDSAAVLHLIHELSEAGADLRQLNIQVGEYWRALMLVKAGADIATILDSTEDEVREIRQAARLFGLEELTEFARIFAQNDLVQKSQGTPQLGLELAFLQSIELHRRPQHGHFAGPMTADPSLQSRATAAPARSAKSQAGSPAHVQPETVLPVPATSRSNEGKAAALPGDHDAIPISEGEDMPGQAATQLSRTSAPAGSTQDNERATTPGKPGVVNATGADSGPSLTLQQVREAWDNVKKRVRPKNPKTAAMLNSFTVIGVEGTVEEAIVVIQAAYELHHKYVQEGERAKDVDWALTTEFRQPCRVRLLAPGATLPSAPVFEAGSFSSKAAVKETPLRSAHLERPASETNPKSSEPEARVEFLQEPYPTNVDASAVDPSLPVARKNIVRENTSTGLPLEIIKQKASSDPVVQEVMRTFTAKIVDIRSK
ncbi:MAG TPA: DNA polymerase III subunit gamma/tau [Ktedonobacter sp.]|jgi:DNA polymerase-3 subunit gamma/tau|nr:DNA polymerase III subunit gamma/tau [Ktedonobacter sp.]HAT45411.1 DNA polymerase III subunit gamma/tau [Ktedonobacter sp.]HCF87503.1 DNA polymerase III subunit gamma/tau [Ktedonobacter sp.]HCJ33516.1 DNA polymerase III subunit gamma/tau [Ktedonobacter sp.]